MRIVIDFKNEEQGKAFMNWFETYGFNELCESDLVHDELPQELFYKDAKFFVGKKLHLLNDRIDGHIKIK